MMRHQRHAPDATAADAKRPRRRGSIRGGITAAGVIVAVGTWALLWSPWVHTPTAQLSLWLAAMVGWALALRPGWPHLRRRHATGWVLATVGLVMLPRTVWLTTAPYNVTLDEVSYPLYGLELFARHPWEILSSVHLEYLTRFGEAVQAWPCLFLEPLLGGRVASVFLALLSLLTTYALGLYLFGARTALAALAVLGASYWHTLYSRTAYSYMQPMLFVALALYLSVRGVSETNRLLQFLGGVLLGACTLVYTPARIAIPVFALWFAHQALHQRRGLRRAATDIATLAAGLLLFLTPYLHTNGLHGILDRFYEVTGHPATPLHDIIAHGWTRAAIWNVLVEQVRQAARIYYRGGAWLAVDVPSAAPLLDPVSLLLGLGGLCAALLRWRESRCFLLAAWIACTFFSGQVFTDIPHSAYRAAPLLPPLAICAGWTAATFAGMLQRRLRLSPRLVDGVVIVGLLAVCLPINLGYLEVQLAQQASNPWVATARFIGGSNPASIYYIVGSGASASHNIFRFLAYGHTMRDMPNVMDDLGVAVDDRREAVFVLSPDMAGAALAIRRCYPGAVLLDEPSGPREDPVLALSVSPPAVGAGRNCSVAARGPGLRARYFASPAWDGAVVLERVEDWPVRFHQDLARYRSVEWSGWLRVPVAGDYAFQLQGSRAVGEARVGDAITVPLNGIKSAALSAGAYPIAIRCRPESADDFCWLRWQPPGGGFAPIPPELLSPPE
jgi:hypothetical protein